MSADAATDDPARAASLHELAALAESTARAAGALLLESAGAAPRGLSTKSSPTDLVSEADRAAEALISTELGRARPADGIIGEEGARAESRSGLTWIVDPLDGTTNFLFGYPHWAVSIACEGADGPLAGCVFDPSRAEAFVATRGGGAALNGTAIAATARSDLGTALVATGFGYDADARASQARQLAELMSKVRDIRRAGAASLDLAWVACGRLDAFYEAGLGPWDWAAGSLLVEEAGGLFSRGPSAHGPDQILACGPGLHRALAALVG